MRRAIKKLPCTVDHWEVGCPFPPHVHVVSKLNEKKFAALLGMSAVVFKAAPDPDRKIRRGKVKDLRYRDRRVGCSYNSNARGSQIGDPTYTRDFRYVDVPGATYGYIHGHDEDM